MEVSGAPADVLLQRPWLPVSISGGQFLAKIWFGDLEYHILLTDMMCVWEERMDSAAIQERAQKLNRRVRAEVKAFFSHLVEVVQPCLSGGGEPAGIEAQVRLMRREGGNISMTLNSKLAGLPFKWEFDCSPAPVTLVCAQLVCPLLAMSRLLQRQVEQLRGLLLRKDAEIQDYRENGATLSRERLQTDIFEEQTYREDFMTKALPLLCSEQPDARGFDADLQHLYTAVIAQANTRTQKRHMSEERPVEEEEEEEEQPDASPSSAPGSVTDGEQSQTKMADRAAVRQSVPATSSAAERPSSKPKKKKVGLFR